MILFDNAEYDYFFNPLCCRNKRIYSGCILQLIEKSKSVPLLYETDAKDIIIIYLRNCTYAVEDEITSSNADENISSKKTETENASAILRYFRRCGWISEREIGRNGDNIATVMPYCRKMIEAIERIFNRDNRAALTNHIFSIYDILSSAYRVFGSRIKTGLVSRIKKTVQTLSKQENRRESSCSLLQKMHIISDILMRFISCSRQGFVSVKFVV